MVYRVLVEKKEGFRNEADALGKDIREFLGIDIDRVRILNCYDAENIPEEVFSRAVSEVFSEPPVDSILSSVPEADDAFRVCYLPGQFDQRARSAEECISFLSPGVDAKVKSSRIYLLYGCSKDDGIRIRKYLINPVEAEESAIEEGDTLSASYPEPHDVAVLDGFRTMDANELDAFRTRYGLAMDNADLALFQRYFIETEHRDPTITELRVCDTYWSDHCRHTTFLTQLDSVVFHDRDAEDAYKEYLRIRKELGRENRPVTLMDIATIGAKILKKRGLLDNLDESEEINACSIKITARIDGKDVPYLLLFKNETHNHPTEIEPFGGAATCIGGAIRDPLSGRAYVYQAMRLTGSGDVTEPFSDTMAGKLPQRKIALDAARGYSSYGNQIGLATGMVDEIYHPGYKAKHMELGAVMGAVPEDHVRREAPVPGDVILLLGGRTGRDGIGGATGSSKSHGMKSLETCSAEVQKGNAPEERKLQRLFMRKDVSLMIKRCNDFGAGGVSVAIGELAPGLDINLDKVPKKYLGLDGTELAISESQERMAVAVDSADAERFIALAHEENLECTPVAVVTEAPVLSMKWRGSEIVHLQRSFLDTNGAEKHQNAVVAEGLSYEDLSSLSVKDALSNLNLSSKQGLSERFDSTIGASTVLLPFGGRYQKTAPEAMAALIPSDHGRSETVSLMAYGYNPYKTAADPFHGSYDAVVDSVSKIVAAGGSRKGTYLTFQEFFGRTGADPARWGRPLAALLGALRAQLDLGTAAIGGKDSMSGTFEDIDVPNTLVSFAVNTTTPDRIISPEFKAAGSCVFLLVPDGDMASYLDRAERIFRESRATAVSTVPYGSISAAIAKMCFGNGIGYEGSTEGKAPAGTFIIETAEPIEGAVLLGHTIESPVFCGIPLEELLLSYENKLSSVYPITSAGVDSKAETFTYDKLSSIHFGRDIRPRAIIPVFTGTNCEIDTKRAFEDAGADSEIFVVSNLSNDAIKHSIESFADAVRNSQILFIPGGFSGADEPDGSGKFITAFMRSPAVMESVMDLLNVRQGLLGGICNGFQALVKLGLLPYGEFREPDKDNPTLTFNTIGRHISHIAHVRVSSAMSPWMSGFRPGEVCLVPISHGEGRFIADDNLIHTLAANGQIAFQYSDPEGNVTMDSRYNLNGSAYAIEGITSPDGRVFGRMGHVERSQRNTMLNLCEGGDSLRFFRSAVGYFKG